MIGTLIEKHPLPWSTKYEHKGHPAELSAVVDAVGGKILTRETYSGDGDSIYLESSEIEELVALVNQSAVSHE